MSSIQLNLSCVLNVPIQTYDTFSFIVNGEQYKTTRLLADLISPVISKIHMNDPIVDSFTIKTSQKGDFSRILQLGNFKQMKFSEDELPYILEVFDILGNDSIKFTLEKVELSNENVFDHIQNHKKYNKLFNNVFLNDIDFISSHFCELCENNTEQLKNLPVDFLWSIINSDKLQLNSEDQLLKFINELYSKDSTYSMLYENVMFSNVSPECMNEFVSVFNYEDINQSIWTQLSNRLSEKTETTNHYIYKVEKRRYNTIEIQPISAEFKGIINYLNEKSNGEIDNEISIIASSTYDGSYQPSNIAMFNNSKDFTSTNLSGSWICIDFRKYKVIPTNYTIKSSSYSSNGYHPKSWVIECSNDNNQWETVDERRNCSTLNGSNIVHTFKMNHQNSKEFRYVRMRSTGNDHSSSYYLSLNSFELFGKLISNNDSK